MSPFTGSQFKLKHSTRGFTLIEMMTSVFILGLIILLIGYEFDHTIAHLLHTQSNVDAESTARTTMAKVVNGLRAATPDANLIPPDPSTVILTPTGNSPSAVLSYRRAAAGSLADPSNVRTVNGAPAPHFYDVTIQCMTPYPSFAAAACGATTPEDLVESIADDASPNVIISQRPLGHDVTGFSVTNVGGADAGLITITLTVAHPYDVKTGNYYTSRCAPTCQYTATSQVYVGGQAKND